MVDEAAGEGTEESNPRVLVLVLVLLGGWVGRG